MMRKAMNRMRGIGAVCAASFDAWIHAPRVAVMGLCVVAYCLLQAEGNARSLQVNGIPVTLTLTEMLFIKLNNGFYEMASLLFLVMVSELLRRIAYQEDMLLRSSKIRWLLGQAAYCVLTVLSMMLCLSALYLLFSWLGGARGLGNAFSETALIEAEQYSQWESLIPLYIRQSTTPWGACLMAAGPMFFFWLSMVLLFLLLGLLGRQMLGPMIYGFLLFFNVAVLVEMFPGGIQTPVSFSTLAAISSRAMGSDTELQLLREALLGYVTACAALMLALMLTVKRADLSFREENRE